VTNSERPSSVRRRPLSLAAIAWASAAVAAVVLLALAVLVWPLSLVRPISVTEQLDALKTVLAIGAGAAGVATLLLAGRRQVHLEENAAVAEADARERRITELYVKAVDQLGADKAPVRLGGMHALERLAQDNPEHRQTVVDVLCAYLRMPFALDLTPTADGRARGFAPRIIDLPGTDAERQELEVRLSAQAIILWHLKAQGNAGSTRLPSYWPGMSLNLTSAVLVDFEFQRCQAAAVRFAGARFVGLARFYGCVIEGDAEFDAATFSDNAWFRRAEFRGPAWFGGTEFRGRVNFGEAQFRKSASFGGGAWLGGCRFADVVEFETAVFAEGVELDGARVFAGGESLDHCTWPAGWAVGPMDPNDADSAEWKIVVRDSSEP